MAIIIQIYKALIRQGIQSARSLLLVNHHNQITSLRLLYHNADFIESKILTSTNLINYPSCSLNNFALGTFWDISEFLICRTDDSRAVRMPNSFKCACVKFVIRRSNSTTRKGPDIRRGENTMFDVLLLHKPSVVQIESSQIGSRGMPQQLYTTSSVTV